MERCLGILIIYMFTASTLHAEPKPEDLNSNSIKNSATDVSKSSSTTSASNESSSSLSEEKKEQSSDKKISIRGTPLNYIPTESELKLTDPQINYDMSYSSGISLKISDLELTDKSFFAEIKENKLNLIWDQRLVKSGTVTMFNRFGKSIWEQPIDGKGTWSIPMVGDKNAPPIPTGEKFRFCMIAGDKKGFSSLCSQWYGAKDIKDGKELIPLKGELLPRVIINSEEQKISGIKKVSIGDNVQFFASIKSEVTYEYLSVPTEVVFRDIIQSENKDNVTIVGLVPAPIDLKSETFPEIEYSKFIKSIQFEDTILPNATFWRAEIPLKTKKLVFPGSGGGVFEYPIEIQNPPLAKDRYYSRHIITGTYKTADQITVSKFNPEEQEGSTQNSDAKKEATAGDSTKDNKGDILTWKIEAPEKFKLNRSYLDVTDENNHPHKLYLDVYRGSPAEASFRLGNVIGGQGGMILFGEVHVSWWFNDLFGWQNPYLSKQRWGISAKHFTAISKVSAELDTGGTEESKLAATDIDLRYRFTPGLWERDETVGFILSQESGDFGRYSLSKLGVGLFWARSMPKIFDDWFNNISFLKYPKWVDMEFVNYVTSMTSGAQLSNDFVINFHGKILWTPTYFGEAGFGYKRYGFQMTEANESFILQTFYGSLGVGMNF